MTKNPVFHVYGSPVARKDHVKYLGHYLCDDLSDDMDILCQSRKLPVYGQGNTLVRKFSMCSSEVKDTLFRSYCSNMYTANLWCSFKKSFENKLNVSHKNTCRITAELPKFSSASRMCMYNKYHHSRLSLGNQFSV